METQATVLGSGVEKSAAAAPMRQRPLPPGWIWKPGHEAQSWDLVSRDLREVSAATASISVLGSCLYWADTGDEGEQWEHIDGAFTLEGAAVLAETAVLGPLGWRRTRKGWGKLGPGVIWVDKDDGPICPSPGATQTDQLTTEDLEGLRVIVSDEIDREADEYGLGAEGVARLRGLESRVDVAAGRVVHRGQHVVDGAKAAREVLIGRDPEEMAEWALPGTPDGWGNDIRGVLKAVRLERCATEEEIDRLKEDKVRLYGMVDRVVKKLDAAREELKAATASGPERQTLERRMMAASRASTKAAREHASTALARAHAAERLVAVLREDLEPVRDLEAQLADARREIEKLRVKPLDRYVEGVGDGQEWFAGELADARSATERLREERDRIADELADATTATVELAEALGSPAAPREMFRAELKAAREDLEDQRGARKAAEDGAVALRGQLSKSQERLTREEALRCEQSKRLARIQSQAGEISAALGMEQYGWATEDHLSRILQKVQRRAEVQDDGGGQ